MKKILMIFIMIFSINNLNAAAFGEKAPNFITTTIDGNQISLEQYKGKKAVWLVFWATWCPYCENEIPNLKNLYKTHSDKVEIIAVNVAVKDSIEKTKQYIKEHDLPYTVVYDGKIAQEYKVRGIPLQIVIDKNGIVVDKRSKVPSEITKKELDLLLKGESKL